MGKLPGDFDRWRGWTVHLVTKERLPKLTWMFGPVARMDNSPCHDGEVTQGYLDVWSGGDDGEVDGEDDDEDEKTSEEEQPVLATKLNA